jgi:XTP/dITP diphosphohydrolase
MSERESEHSRARIVLATRNPGKIREFAKLLRPFGETVLGLDAFPSLPEVEESGQTFAENALIKARAACRGAGLVAIADDSGLEVDFLDKAPGARSARYSESPGFPATDERNVRKLLDELAGVPRALRTARFRCCMAACSPGGEEILTEGCWEGVVADQPSGGNGFGYDPVFFDEDLGCTAADMTADEKNARSHRAKAAAALLLRWPVFRQGDLARLAHEPYGKQPHPCPF